MTFVASSRDPAPGERIEDLLSQLASFQAANREIDHRVANSLQILASLLTIQKRQVEDAGARAALEEAGARIAAVARVHRRLSSDGITGEVDLSRLLDDLSEEMAAALGIDCHAVGEPLLLSAKTAIPLALVVNELVLNACKHGSDSPDGCEVTISQGIKDGRLEVVVADQGRGLPDGFDPSAPAGIGMHVMGVLLHQIGGELRAHSDGGAWFTVTVPLS